MIPLNTNKIGINKHLTRSSEQIGIFRPDIGTETIIKGNYKSRSKVAFKSKSNIQKIDLGKNDQIELSELVSNDWAGVKKVNLDEYLLSGPSNIRLKFEVRPGSKIRANERTKRYKNLKELQKSKIRNAEPYMMGKGVLIPTMPRTKIPDITKIKTAVDSRQLIKNPVVLAQIMETRNELDIMNKNDIGNLNQNDIRVKSALKLDLKQDLKRKIILREPPDLKERLESKLVKPTKKAKKLFPATLPELSKQNRGGKSGIGFGKRTLEHYVKDPSKFVMGKPKGNIKL
jgi:hypothetical protein